MTLPIVRQGIVQCGMVRYGIVQYGIVRRGFSPASKRLSDNSQRNTGVFNDLPVTVQGISGQPLTGRKPDNSIPSLLLSDPAVSLLPAGFFSQQSLPSPADNTTSREAGITMPTINHPTTRPSHNGSAASLAPRFFRFAAIMRDRRRGVWESESMFRSPCASSVS